MGKGFKHGGGGGGGSSLNFNVVLGTSQPSSPKANDIWVNTSNTSNAAWVFSATQPTGQTNLIWIKIGTDSGAAFNALTENGIWVYPVEAKQYVNRAWKDVTAKSYIGGKWVEWVSNLYLFRNGDQCVSNGGSWGKHNFTNSSMGQTHSIQVLSGSLYIDGNQSSHGVGGKQEKINFSGYNTLFCNVSSANGSPTLIISDSTDVRDSKILTADLKVGLVSVNVSAISKAAYLYFWGYDGNNATITEVYLAK